MNWPADKTEPVEFEKIVEPLLDFYRQMFPKNKMNFLEDRALEWEGMRGGLIAGCLTAEETLTAEYIRRQQEEQGRSAMETLFSVAVQLGILQGQRLQRQRDKGLLDIARGFLNNFCDPSR